MLGVSDSNVQNWIRTGDAPPIVRTAFEAKLELLDFKGELASMGRDDFLIERLANDLGYRVLGLDQRSGLFRELASATNLGHARAIVHVASGALQEKILAVVNTVSDLIEDDPDSQRVVNNLCHWNEPTRREVIAEFQTTLEDLV